MKDGVSPSGKAAGFGPAIRRFESFYPRLTFVKNEYLKKKLKLGKNILKTKLKNLK